MTESVIFSNRVYASVAHRYWNPQWDEATNLRTYGQDTSREGIGSNFRLEISITASVGAAESIVEAPLALLKSKVDHQCLFNEESELHARASTLENITLWLGRLVFHQPPTAGVWKNLTIWESDRLGCVIEPGRDTVRLIFKENNLTLHMDGLVDPSSGIAMPRRLVREAVVQLNEINDSDPAKWSEKLLLHLRESIPGLRRLVIDLGRHESL